MCNSKLPGSTIRPAPTVPSPSSDPAVLIIPMEPDLNFVGIIGSQEERLGKSLSERISNCECEAGTILDLHYTLQLALLWQAERGKIGSELETPMRHVETRMRLLLTELNALSAFANDAINLKIEAVRGEVGAILEVADDPQVDIAPKWKEWLRGTGSVVLRELETLRRGLVWRVQDEAQPEVGHV